MKIQCFEISNALQIVFIKWQKTKHFHVISWLTEIDIKHLNLNWSKLVILTIFCQILELSFWCTVYKALHQYGGIRGYCCSRRKSSFPNKFVLNIVLSSNCFKVVLISFPVLQNLTPFALKTGKKNTLLTYVNTIFEHNCKFSVILYRTVAGSVLSLPTTWRRYYSSR